LKGDPVRHFHNGRLHSLIFTAFLSCLLAAPATATEQVYVPVNPSFGGSPLNGSVLLSSAQAQNRFKEDSSGAQGQQSALEQFNDSLQRAILSRVASAVSSNVVGNNGQLVPGTVETTDFRILISDLGGGKLQITTTDKATGQTTMFEVSQ